VPDEGVFVPTFHFLSLDHVHPHMHVSVNVPVNVPSNVHVPAVRLDPAPRLLEMPARKYVVTVELGAHPRDDDPEHAPLNQKLQYAPLFENSNPVHVGLVLHAAMQLETVDPVFE